jgi:Uma2 family endonuclease
MSETVLVAPELAMDLSAHAAPSAFPPRAPMTYEAYLALSSEPGGLAEWVDGEVVYHMPPLTAHQKLVTYLTTLLNLFAVFFRLGQVIPAAFEMRCRPGGPSRQPDVLFVASHNLGRLSESRLDGPADLAIEIVSDDSVARDYDEKYTEYQECGVPEYWIVDPRPRRQRALFYQLSPSGSYQPVPPDAGVYRSRALPGFWLQVDWLWSQPDPLLAFGEISRLPDAVMQALRALKPGGAD